MLIHHLWGFPDRQPVGRYALVAPKLPFTINDQNPYVAVGKYGKICVVLFMFLAGIGLYRQFCSGKLHLWRKIKHFYLSYWKVFFIFIPIAFFFFKDQEQLTKATVSFYNIYTQFDLNTFILNLFGLKTSYNSEWWFVFAYAISCIFGYVYIYMTRKCNNLYIELLIVACINTVFYRIIPIFIDLSSFSEIKKSAIYTLYLRQQGVTAFFTGIVAAKYNVLENMISRMKQHSLPCRIVLSVSGLLATLYIRNYNSGNIYDFFTAPFIVVFFLTLIKLEKVPFLYKFFVFFGKNSENIWLTHSFFCYYFSSCVRIVFKTGNYLISLLTLMGMSLLSSICINYVFVIFKKAKEFYQAR